LIPEEFDLIFVEVVPYLGDENGVDLLIVFSGYPDDISPEGDGGDVFNMMIDFRLE